MCIEFSCARRPRRRRAGAAPRALRGARLLHAQGLAA
jgi:hypothetical protein